LELLEALILGIIQGLTEFLPVSSSGHLEIAKAFFGDNMLAKESMLMTVILSQTSIPWPSIIKPCIALFTNPYMSIQLSNS